MATFIATGSTLAMYLFWFLLNAFLPETVYNGLAISQSAITVEYFELNRVDKLFDQSMNTYSNLAYFFLGIFVLNLSKEDRKQNDSRNRIRQFPGSSVL